MSRTTVTQVMRFEYGGSPLSNDVKAEILRRIRIWLGDGFQPGHAIEVITSTSTEDVVSVTRDFAGKFIVEYATVRPSGERGIYKRIRFQNVAPVINIIRAGVYEPEVWYVEAHYITRQEG